MNPEVKRGSYAIEHVMPQAWHKHWPLPADIAESERDDHIHRLGKGIAVIDPKQFSMSDAVAIMTGAMQPPANRGA